MAVLPLYSPPLFPSSNYALDFNTFITEHNVLLEVYLIQTHTHKTTITIFSWNFGIVPATQPFCFCFNQLTKPTTFTPAVMTKPVFPNRPWVDISTLYSFYRWRFSLALCRKVSEYWSQTILSRLRVIERSVEIIVSHAADAVFYIWY